MEATYNNRFDVGRSSPYLLWWNRAVNHGLVRFRGCKTSEFTDLYNRVRFCWLVFVWSQEINYRDKARMDIEMEEIKTKKQIASFGKHYPKKSKAMVDRWIRGDFENRWDNPEFKLKMSKAHMGNKSRTGQHLSPETIEKMIKTRTGSHRSEETKKRMSLAQKGRPKSVEHKAKLSQSLIGRHLPEQHKTNISKALKGKLLGRVCSAQTKDKMSKAKLGTHHTDEARTKMSKSRKGKKFSDSHKENLSKASNTIENIEKKRAIHKGNKYNLGRHASDETRAKMSEAHRGEKCHLWLGGKSFEPYTPDFNNALKEQIRKRDNYTCQICGVHENGVKLGVHHVDYDKTNNQPNNLISLCSGAKRTHSCHTKTNYNREFWTLYFSQKVGK